MASLLTSFSSQSLFTQRLSLISGNPQDSLETLNQPTSDLPKTQFVNRVEQTEVVISRSLKIGLGVDIAPEPATDPSSSFFDVDKVVDTVLDFVGSRIGQAQAAGASDEEVEGLFDAARQGVEKGFAQARNDLRSFGKTDETLFENVDRAEADINEGIDELEERTFSDDDIAVELPAVTSANYAAVYERNTESFEFELTTQDGDRVSIVAISDQAVNLSASAARGEGGSSLSASASQYSAFGFSLSVEGELDESEQLAIAELLAQVDDISEQFYSGNIGAAFELALQIYSDPEEIASFSLDLRQTQVSVIESVYQRSGYQGGSLPTGIAEPLAEFASSIRESYGLAAQFEDARGLIERLFEQLDTQRSISKVLDPFLNVLDA